MCDVGPSVLLYIHDSFVWAAFKPFLLVYDWLGITLFKISVYTMGLSKSMRRRCSVTLRKATHTSKLCQELSVLPWRYETLHKCPDPVSYSKALPTVTMATINLLLVFSRMTTWVVDPILGSSHSGVPQIMEGYPQSVMVFQPKHGHITGGNLGFPYGLTHTHLGYSYCQSPRSSADFWIPHPKPEPLQFSCLVAGIETSWLLHPHHPYCGLKIPVDVTNPYWCFYISMAHPSS